MAIDPAPPAPRDATPRLVPIVGEVAIEGASAWDVIAWICRCNTPEPDDGPPEP